eukprot:2779172-Karenia_brevis.AAC.1
MACGISLLTHTGFCCTCGQHWWRLLRSTVCVCVICHSASCDRYLNLRKRRGGNYWALEVDLLWIVSCSAGVPSPAHWKPECNVLAYLCVC